MYLLAGVGHSADWVQNLVADPTVLVELDGTERKALARVLSDDEESERARELVHAKCAPRSASVLSSWRDRALPVTLDLTTP